MLGSLAEPKLVLDLGPGDDLLVWPGATVTGFDKPGIPEAGLSYQTSAEQGYVEGDLNKIDEYFSPATWDAIHSSQVMEHVYDPVDVLRRCQKIVKPGGFIIFTVPDLDLYEHGRLPSRYNADHKTSWSLWRRKAPSRFPRIWKKKFPHIWVPSLKDHFNVLSADLIDTNYNYLKYDVDQTINPEDGVEAFIEVVIQC